jgi:hypothetical protein
MPLRIQFGVGKKIIFKTAWVYLLFFCLLSCSKTDETSIIQAPTESAKIAAASATANNNSFCSLIYPFYWEIGSANGSLGSGTTGDNSVTSTTTLSIASASKLIFASYVVEKRNGSLTTDDIKSLNFTSGYSTFSSCVGYVTVNGCYTGTSAYVPADDNKYYYSGGHMQKLAAVDLGLAALGVAGLATELSTFLGSDIGITFSIPQPAGGIRLSAEGYGIFLRKILNGNLRIIENLGSNSVCTNVSVCPTTSVSTPIPSTESWNYSLGHWIENDSVQGDGSFSSPGLYGFYPWINSDKTRYGIIARYDTGINAYWESVECGRLIRKAYVTGQEQ